MDALPNLLSRETASRYSSLLPNRRATPTWGFVGQKCIYNRKPISGARAQNRRGELSVTMCAREDSNPRPSVPETDALSD